MDLKEFTENCVSTRNRAKDDTKVKWNDIHSFQYRKEYPTEISFEYESSQPEDNSIDIQSVKNRGEQTISWNYSSLVPISDAKYKDFISLCKKIWFPTFITGFIPISRIRAAFPIYWMNRTKMTYQSKFTVKTYAPKTIIVLTYYF